MTKAETMIRAELKRRMDLVNNVEFRKLAAVAAEKLGITAKEWNENKAGILMLMANEAISQENKMLA